MSFIDIPDNLVKLRNLFFNNYKAADFFFRLPAEAKHQGNKTVCLPLV